MSRTIAKQEARIYLRPGSVKGSRGSMSTQVYNDDGTPAMTYRQGDNGAMFQVPSYRRVRYHNGRAIVNEQFLFDALEERGWKREAVEKKAPVTVSKVKGK